MGAACCVEKFVACRQNLVKEFFGTLLGSHLYEVVLDQLAPEIRNRQTRVSCADIDRQNDLGFRIEREANRGAPPSRGSFTDALNQARSHELIKFKANRGARLS